MHKATFSTLVSEWIWNYCKNKARLPSCWLLCLRKQDFIPISGVLIRENKFQIHSQFVNASPSTFSSSRRSKFQLFFPLPPQLSTLVHTDMHIMLNLCEFLCALQQSELKVENQAAKRWRISYPTSSHFQYKNHHRAFIYPVVSRCFVIYLYHWLLRFTKVSTKLNL